MLVSVIVPAYNVGKYIESTLESLQNQTSTDFEVILVNDASNDNTQEIIENFIRENQLSNFTLVNHQKNFGVSTARNTGIKKATGKYLMFLDGDDYVDVNLIQKIKQNRIDNNSELIIFGFDRVTSKNQILNEYFNKYEFTNTNITGEKALNEVANKKTFQMCVANIVYSKEFILNNSLFYTDSCVSGEDTEFIYKSFILANEISFIHEVLFYYVIRKGSITNSYNLKKFQTIYAVKRIYEFGLKYGSSHEKEILEKEVSNMLIFRYIFNYNSCLEYLLGDKYSNKKAIDKLNSDLDITYPNLRSEMMSLINNYSGDRLKILLKAIVFRISPILYNKTYKLIT